MDQSKSLTRTLRVLRETVRALSHSEAIDP